LFGSKRDRSKGASSQDGPTLFDQEFNEAYDARQQELKDAERQVADTSATRRAAARKRSASNRPEKYRYSGLEERALQQRQSTGKTIMDGILAMFAPAAKQCTPSDPLGKAIDYANKMWDRIKRYALDARYHLDNNPVERMQRPTVMGCKNYLFSKNDCGAVDNAVFYTLLESCAVVGVNPLKWLTYALERIRPDMDEDKLVALLPYNCKAEL